jgi:hypothetical protein
MDHAKPRPPTGSGGPSHVSNIFTKLDVSSRAAATAYAYQHHLL